MNRGGPLIHYVEKFMLSLATVSLFLHLPSGMVMPPCKDVGMVLSYDLGSRRPVSIDCVNFLPLDDLVNFSFVFKAVK